MKLIGSLTSPYVRKVRVVLAEKHIDYEIQVDIPWNEDSKVPEYNPLGKVPVLLLDDGTNLFDSRVIVEHLDNVTPLGKLIPDDNRERTAVKRWEALGDGISDAAAAIVVEKKRPAKLQSKDWISRQHGKVQAGLRAAARELDEKNWCSGDSYNLSDIALGCALGFLDLRLPEIDWRTAHPNLEKLYGKLMQRQSFKDTVPPAS
ncbi:MAG TPA: glutathione S-transferase [Burkholderiales bacterium]|nr:glutathione S-transferase [Burkholderiales bacterium]